MSRLRQLVALIALVTAVATCARETGAMSASPATTAPSAAVITPSPVATPPAKSPSPMPTKAAVASPARTWAGTGFCPTAPVTVELLIEMRSEHGPLTDRFGTRFDEWAAACYASDTLTFTAFDGRPEGLGGTVTYSLDPAWLDAWNEPATFLEDHELGSFLTVAVPPGLREAFDAHDGQWVVVSGRFNDPAAEECRAAAKSGDHPTAKQLVAMCRTSFVLSSIEPTVAPS